MFDHSEHQQHHPRFTHNKAFAIGITLNVLFIAAEVFYGITANSLALLADAWHNAGDVLGLAIAWLAMLLARLRPTERYTYGLQSSSILAALANALLLMVAVGGIILESFHRLHTPHGTNGEVIVWVALFGVFINGMTALFFFRDSHNDLNIRGAYLHMAADAGVSLGVVVSGFVIMRTGWQWFDPATSIAIALVIVISTWGLLRDSVNMALQGVPRTVKLNEVREFLKGLEGVKEVHDLHIWAMSTSETALSAHLLMPQGHPGDSFIWNTVNTLAEKFDIAHATIQIEMGDMRYECKLLKDDKHQPRHQHHGHHHHNH
jgi:cobalt-zinc-cadmium efflux system protein